MIFTLEALQAFEGDCLLLHVGPADAPKLVLIDGGPTATWATSLKPRLEEIREHFGAARTLRIDLVIVSHIDGDHVQGLLQLTTEMLANTKLPPPLEVLSIWHNAFDDVRGNGEKELHAIATERLPPDVRSVVASIPEGRQLRIAANTLGWRVNGGFKGLVSVAAAAPKKLGEGTELTVVSPGPKQLKALHAKWEDWLEKAKPGDLIPASLDSSVFNRSSIVVLVKAGGKSMLLTGDARADDIRTGLVEAGIALPLKVDVLKLPHHGSRRNSDDKLFEQVRADHYVISANGSDGNPDTPTLDMLARARKDDAFELHLTNRAGVQGVGPRLEEWVAAQRKRGRRFKVSFRDDAAHALRIDLGEKLGY